ncbi:MAG: 1-phosphofructokinase [Deltaproteobacteria bacterium]|nr:1-phosphofructokinase [Deltaproteobacteria bacterium]
MIYTVTLNPALDRAMLVEELNEDDTTRIVNETYYAAGKGIDVSRVIRELGGQSVALGLVGGYDGLHLEGMLINAGVMTNFTRISQETRTNIILKEKKTGRQFVISASGPEINATEIGQFYQNVLAVQGMDFLIMSGSLPRGVSPNLYGQLVLAGKKKGAFVFLDSDGEALKESIAYQPTGIKPNIHELSRLVGRELKTEPDILKACEEVHQKGVEFVLASRGKDGLILSTPEQKIKAIAPPVKIESTVGAGDSTVAGFVLAYSREKDLQECVRFACAAGAAAVETPGTELCHRATFERILPDVIITIM